MRSTDDAAIRFGSKRTISERSIAISKCSSDDGMTCTPFIHCRHQRTWKGHTR